MNRKLLTTCLALAAFAVMPATSSATNDPQFTTSEGALVAPGSMIKLTAIGETRLANTAGESLVSCATATGEGALIKNSGGTVEGEITSVVVGGTGAQAAGEPGNECTGNFGNVSATITTLPWCLRSTPTMATDEGQISAGKCPGGGNIKFLLVSTTVGECEYESTGPIKGHFSTSPTDAQATVTPTSASSGFKRIKGGFLCPNSATLSGTATAEDGSGKPLYVS